MLMMSGSEQGRFYKERRKSDPDIEDDRIRHRIMKMERKQKVQVRDLCREGEWRSWTSMHNELDPEKFQRQNERIKILERQGQQPAACSYKWRQL